MAADLQILPQTFNNRNMFSDYPEYVICTYFESEKRSIQINGTNTELEVRPVLIDMFKTIARTYNYSQATLFLAVYFLDIYMDCYEVSKYEDHQRLTGLVCLLLAAKSEDVDSAVPSIKDLLCLVDLTDDLGFDMRFKDELNPLELSIVYKKFANLYSKLEFLIFECLKFNTIRPTVATFINVFHYVMVTEADITAIRCGDEEEECQTLASLQVSANIYLREFLSLYLHSTDFYNILPSKIAAAMIASVRKLLKIENYWNNQLKDLTKWTNDDIRSCMIKLIQMRINASYSEEAVLDDDLIMAESGYISENVSDTTSDEEMEKPVVKKRKLELRPELIYAVL